MPAKEKVQENFFEFINFETQNMDRDQLLLFAKKYVGFACQSDEAIEKFNLFVSSTFDDCNDDVYEKRIRLLKAVQQHLRDKIESIINSSEVPIVIEQKGTRTIKIINNEIIEEFSPERIRNKKMTMETEKQIVEIALGDMILNEKLLLKRFKKCGHCGNYFYHAKMLFCSTKCANASRQREYQRKKLAE